MKSGTLSAGDINSPGRSEHADYMATVKSARPSGPRYVDAICTSVEDKGIISMKFGPKPMLKFTFESDEINEYGSKRRYTRLFHKHNHPKSSLSIAINAWTGRDLADEAEDIDDVNFESFEKLPARLTLEPGAVRDGIHYENVTAIEAVAERETNSTKNKEAK